MVRSLATGKSVTLTPNLRTLIDNGIPLSEIVANAREEVRTKQRELLETVNTELSNNTAPFHERERILKTLLVFLNETNALAKGIEEGEGSPHDYKLLHKNGIKVLVNIPEGEDLSQSYFQPLFSALVELQQAANHNENPGYQVKVVEYSDKPFSDSTLDAWFRVSFEDENTGKSIYVAINMRELSRYTEGSYEHAFDLGVSQEFFHGLTTISSVLQARFNDLMNSRQQLSHMLTEIKRLQQELSNK